jgi:murein L,D-transpeptidase YcbB/YkuD
MKSRRPGRTRALIGLVLIGALAGLGACSTEHDRAVRDALEEQLGRRVRLFRRPTVDIDDVQPLARRFYRERGFRPAWISSWGPTGAAHALVDAIEAAPRDGLDPRHYGLDSIQAVMRQVDTGLFGPGADPRRLAALDLRLTRTFLGYAAHLASGQVDPKKLPTEWHVAPRQVDLVATLNQALERRRVGKALADLAPSDRRYASLRDLLARYRAIAAAGGWPSLPDGRPPRRGQRGDRVALLRARLIASGDLAAAPRAKPVFDAATEEAVRRFQRRHGLEPDGTVGPDELAAMNVPVERRIHQIELNMEQWRWRAQPLGERYVMVNIPDYSLRVVEDERTVMTMRVVVGERFTQTPLFSDEIIYLVLNPWWNVPPAIIVNEMLPAIQDDDDYLEKNTLHVFDGPGREAVELDPRSIHWDDLSAEDFDSTVPDHPRGIFLRQEPGPANPLGRIKFMCPNPFDIYLHDTPAGHLFGARERDFSHGCIRAEKPLDLAEYLLYGKAGENHDALVAALASSRDSTLKLPRSIPVHLLYWTAWVDDQGEVQFRDDVYGLDRALDQALGRSGPTAWLDADRRRSTP